MPELPEVEISARLIGAALTGAEIESALAPGINAVKTFDPPLHALAGARIEGIRRRGKLFLIDLDGPSATAQVAPGFDPDVPADLRQRSTRSSCT